MKMQKSGLIPCGASFFLPKLICFYYKAINKKENC